MRLPIKAKTPSAATLEALKDKNALTTIINTPRLSKQEEHTIKVLTKLRMDWLRITKAYQRNCYGKTA